MKMTLKLDPCKQTQNIMRHNLRHNFIREPKILKAQSQQYSLAPYLKQTLSFAFFHEVQNQTFSFLGERKTTQVQLVSPYYIISDHCVRERALVASYFGQVIGQYFFLEHCRRRQSAAAASACRHAAWLPWRNFWSGAMSYRWMTAYGRVQARSVNPSLKVSLVRGGSSGGGGEFLDAAAVFKSVPSQCTAQCEF